jgi:hypothetical protein
MFSLVIDYLEWRVAVSSRGEAPCYVQIENTLADPRLFPSASHAVLGAVQYNDYAGCSAFVVRTTILTFPPVSSHSAVILHRFDQKKRPPL